MSIKKKKKKKKKRRMIHNKVLLRYNMVSQYSGVRYNERCYNERMLQRRVFINKIRMLQRTQMLQRKWSNTVGRRSTRVRITCRNFPLWLERQSSSFLPFVRSSYQFSSVICLFVQRIKVKWINFVLFYIYFFDFVLYFSCLNGCVGW